MFLIFSMVAWAQDADYSKMSYMVRRAVADAHGCRRGGKMVAKGIASLPGRTMCAFVRISGDGDKVLALKGCRALAQFGDIYIADIPLDSLSALSLNKSVERIEASASNFLAMDTTSIIVDAVKVFAGDCLPQAYTGSGVVLGAMDVGYDLTHPGFYDRQLTAMRVRRFWDQLSPDSLGSTLYVGADYRTETEILNYAHSFDATIETHGTYTLGIAAGTGYDTPYQGMAPDADLCLVSNAVSSNISCIPPQLYYKYTSATDALGFKYIFDYAQEVGKPCVISFSEGSTDRVDDDQQLYYEVLASMIGKGRILVASAGNCGYYNTYLHKPEGRDGDGVFLKKRLASYPLTAFSAKPFTIRLTAYGQDEGSDVPCVSVEIPTSSVVSVADSLLTGVLEAYGEEITYEVQAYTPTLQDATVAYDIVIGNSGNEPVAHTLSVEVVGVNADVQLFSNGKEFLTSELNRSLSGGESSHNVLCPSTSPAVISVGATSYRDHYIDKDGNLERNYWGLNGERAGYSSVGPSCGGLMKPDVVAPGTLIKGAMSSFYPQDRQASKVQSYSYYNDRCYPWWADVGTSLSAPVVAGTIALWLQANPQLTTEQIMQILSETCHRRDGKPQGEKDAEYGYGEIDAYAGLLKVLNLDGIKELSAANPRALSVALKEDKSLELVADSDEAGKEKLKVSVYSLLGRKLLERTLTLSCGRAHLPLGSLPSGVYAVQVSSSRKSLTGSVLIRLPE